MEKHEEVKRSRKDIITNNFLGGIFWAFGITLGFAIIAVVLAFVLSRVNPQNTIGNFVTEVIEVVLQNNPQLVK